MSRTDRLSDDEIVRLASVFIAWGVRSVRLTGGEPLVHPTVVDVVRRLKELAPVPEVSLTTNGLTLDRQAQALVGAGLDRINISLDTLDREHFAALTRRDRLDDVLRGIEGAAAAGLSPVKLNSVLVRDGNVAEAPALLQWALQRGFELRFIEHMPLDADHTWSRAVMVSAEEILSLLGQTFTLRPVPREGPAATAPAEEFLVLDGPDSANWAVRPGRLGVIASVTRPFCRDCDRLRLTADGQLRTCLFAHTETDLRGPLRDGASDAELGEVIRAAVAGKQAGHGIDKASFVQPVRTMSAIGG